MMEMKQAAAGTGTLTDETGAARAVRFKFDII
jgi:hypothetical protein